MKNVLIISVFLLGFLVNAQETERPRTVLLEGFTSSTCVPCVDGNINLKNVLMQNSGSFALIKYQMNWPGNGDPYYTDEGGVKRGVYNVQGVPQIQCDGSSLGIGTTSLTNSALSQLQTVPANMDMDISYSIEGKKVSATVTITPSVDISGTDLRLYIAIVERITYENWRTNPSQSNGEKEFSQVMKKFMPDANGIAVGNLTAGTPVEFEQEWTFKGEYRRPNNGLAPINHGNEHTVETFENLAVVAWVQNTSTKKVLQACQENNKKYVAFKTISSDGKISATYNGNTQTNDILINDGDEVTFTATPNPRFVVKEWKVNGVIVPDNSTNQLILSNIDKDCYVSVSFLQVELNVQFSVQNNVGGTITASVDEEPINSNDYIYRGSKVVFTATKNPGYEIMAWRLNNSLILGYSANEYVVKSLDDNINVTVEFRVSHYTVSYSTVNTFGTLTAVVSDEEIESGGYVTRGSRVFFTATPMEGCTVKEWKNNGVTIFGNTTPEYTINALNNNANVTVEFSRGDKLFVSIEINPENAGTVTGAEGLFDPNADVTLTAIPNDGWIFKNWTKSGVIVSETEKYSFKIIEDVFLIANFDVPENIKAESLSETVLYPNPFKNEINIIAPYAVKSVQISNATGQKVKSITFDGSAISTKELAQGIYFVIIEGYNNEKEVKKMIKK